MKTPSFRFGVFEVDLAARELRKSGVRIKLQDQPFRVLALPLERPGEIVKHEELPEAIWSKATLSNSTRAPTLVSRGVCRAV